MGIGLGFAGGIYLSRRSAFTRFQRTIVIFVSSITGEFVGRKVGEVRSQETFNQLVPNSPIHKMNVRYFALRRQLSDAIKRSALPNLSQTSSNKPAPIPIASHSGAQDLKPEVESDPYDPSGWEDVFENSNSTSKKPVRKNQYGDIIE
jgi:hypothetical protein